MCIFCLKEAAFFIYCNMCFSDPLHFNYKEIKDNKRHHIKEETKQTTILWSSLIRKEFGYHREIQQVKWWVIHNETCLLDCMAMKKTGTSMWHSQNMNNHHWLQQQQPLYSKKVRKQWPKLIQTLAIQNGVNKMTSERYKKKKNPDERKINPVLCLFLLVMEHCSWITQALLQMKSQ